MSNPTKLKKLERAASALDRTRQERLSAYNKVLAERTKRAQAIESAQRRLDDLVTMSRAENHPDLALMGVLSSTERRLRATLEQLRAALQRFDKEHTEPAQMALTEAAVQVRAVESLVLKRKLDALENQKKQEALLLDELSQQGWLARSKR